MKKLLTIALMLVSLNLTAQTTADSDSTLVMQIELNEEVNSSMWIEVQRGF